MYVVHGVGLPSCNLLLAIVQIDLLAVPLHRAS